MVHFSLKHVAILLLKQFNLLPKMLCGVNNMSTSM